MVGTVLASGFLFTPWTQRQSLVGIVGQLAVFFGHLLLVKFVLAVELDHKPHRLLVLIYFRHIVLIAGHAKGTFRIIGARFMLNLVAKLAIPMLILPLFRYPIMGKSLTSPLS
jgi:hypothetical protein